RLVSRSSLETGRASIIKLVRPLAPRNFLNGARSGKVHRDHWHCHHTGWVGDVEWPRPKMAGPIARRYSNPARTFGVLFSHRYLHRSQHRLEFDSVALLDL